MNLNREMNVNMLPTVTSIPMRNGGHSCLDFSYVESQINRLLFKRWHDLRDNDELMHDFSTLFTPTLHAALSPQVKGLGLYLGDRQLAPSEAYMKSLEWMWEQVDRLLAEYGLKIDQSLRDSYPQSREFQDQRTEFRRVFTGQFVDAMKGVAISSFMLSVCYSNQEFCYSAPVAIQISRRAGSDIS